jgi:hypothetical protein
VSQRGREGGWGQRGGQITRGFGGRDGKQRTGGPCYNKGGWEEGSADLIVHALYHKYPSRPDKLTEAGADRLARTHMRT